MAKNGIEREWRDAESRAEIRRRDDTSTTLNSN